MTDHNDTTTEQNERERSAYHLEPIYAMDDHAGLVVTEEFEVIASTEAEAKQYVLNYSGRDSVEGWLTIHEHDARGRVPEKRDSGVIRITEDEWYEMRSEADRGMSACWICGPYDIEEADGFQQCATCGMTTSMSKLLDKDGTELQDGTAFIKKSLRALPADIDNTEANKTSELLAELM